MTTPISIHCVIYRRFYDHSLTTNDMNASYPDVYRIAIDGVDKAFLRMVDYPDLESFARSIDSFFEVLNQGLSDDDTIILSFVNEKV